MSRWQMSWRLNASRLHMGAERRQSWTRMSGMLYSSTLIRWKLEPRCNMWSPHWAHPWERSWVVMGSPFLHCLTSWCCTRRVGSSSSWHREGGWNVCYSSHSVTCRAHQRRAGCPAQSRGGSLWLCCRQCLQNILCSIFCWLQAWAAPVTSGRTTCTWQLLMNSDW